MKRKWVVGQTKLGDTAIYEGDERMPVCIFMGEDTETAEDIVHAVTAQLEWQKAALKLREKLYLEHEMKCDALGTLPPLAHRSQGCSICKLLEDTRWCMKPLSMEDLS